MPLNPMKLLQIKNAWDRFTASHPKFPLFLKAIQKQGITEGTILELKVTAPDGRELCSNLKLTPEDMELYRELQELSR